MPRSEDIVASAADLNLKKFLDKEHQYADMMLSDSIDHRRRTQVHAEHTLVLGQAIMTRAAKDIVELDTEEASAIETVRTGNAVAQSIASFGAALGGLGFNNKALDLSPPKQ